MMSLSVTSPVEEEGADMNGADRDGAQQEGGVADLDYLDLNCAYGTHVGKVVGHWKGNRKME